MDEYIGWYEGLCLVTKGQQIIRCRDCKHFRDVPMADGSMGHRCSGVLAFVEPTPDGFCAWGEHDA